jgi:two-component system, NarL family, sensor histidine kinase DegS
MTRRSGAAARRAYTRLSMERELSVEPGARPLEEQYEEARRLIGAAAAQLRATVERYRELSAAGREGTPGETGRDGSRSDLAKLELAAAHLERTRHFLDDGGDSLVPGGDPELPTDVQVRVVEAQEAERQRLAQEVHDGPAQALTNAIFQVEYIERLQDRDPTAARGEMRFLRDRLRRELADVRTFITQLRPPLLDEIGLYGAIRDHADGLADATGAEVDVDLAAPPDALGDTQQTVILRIVQEALQNIRRHAHARYVRIVTRLGEDAFTDGDAEGPTGSRGRGGARGPGDRRTSAGELGRDWILEITDDGRGFDPAQATTSRGSRSFGLRFMRERADLIGARLSIDSRPDGGTRIRVLLPGGTERR